MREGRTRSCRTCKKPAFCGNSPLFLCHVGRPLTMRSVAYIVLRFIHALHSVLFFAYSCWKRLAYVAPLSLTAPRRQIPKHLAILFIPDSETHYDLTEKCLLESVYRVLDWCREVGIATITFYDERGTCSRYTLGSPLIDITGLLKALTPTIERHVSSSSLSLTDEDHSAYPPTPPLSDCASRSMSPVHPYTTSPFTVIHAPFDSRRAPGAGKFSRNSPGKYPALTPRSHGREQHLA